MHPQHNNKKQTKNEMASDEEQCRKKVSSSLFLPFPLLIYLPYPSFFLLSSFLHFIF
jgi:hypothetical protein